MKDWKNKIIRFMKGRRGADELGQFLLLASLVFILVSFFLHIKLFYLVSVILLVFCMFRLLSKDINKRFQENQRYLDICHMTAKTLRINKRRFKDRKEYKYYKCPNCGQMIRIPKKIGKVSITCPKCKHKFTRSV